MFKFFKEKKQLPADQGEEIKEPVKEDVLHVVAEMESKRLEKEKKLEEARKKMREDAGEMYKKIIEEAKAKGDTKKQKIYEAALQELEKQISKDEEKKEE